MRDKIHCLMTSSVFLSSNMRNVLFDVACEMMGSNAGRKRFADGDFEGVVTTSFESKILSGISGVEFTAEVETELGKGKVKFLVRPADVKTRNELEWFPLFFNKEGVPVGLDESPSRRAPMCN